MCWNSRERDTTCTQPVDRGVFQCRVIPGDYAAIQATARHRYIWHEAAIPLAPNGDYTIVQNALESAVMPVFKEYKLDSLWQRSAYDQTEFPLNPPEPQHRLQFSDSGPELVARYPVALNRATEIDEKITRALSEAIQKNDQVAHAMSGPPKIRAAVKG